LPGSQRALPGLGEQADQDPVAFLPQRIVDRQLTSKRDRSNRVPRLLLKPHEPQKQIRSERGEALAFEGDPILERCDRDCQALQELAAPRRIGLLESSDLGRLYRAPKLVRINGQSSGLNEVHRVLVGDQRSIRHRRKRAPDSDQRLPEALTRLLSSAVSPEQRGEDVARNRASAVDAQAGEQRLGLLGEVSFRATGEDLEAPEQAHCDDSSLA
jgi:hypothetical protein